MKSTLTIAGNLNISPFEIFQQDVDEVIMLLNFYLYLGENKKEDNGSQLPTTEKSGAVRRVHVNDRTATGGWF